MEDAIRAERLRIVLGLEVHRITDDLLRRRSLLVELWGRHRVRSPFLDTTFQRYRGLVLADLLLLERAEIEAVEAFYRELDDLRFYLSHTEDMPKALADTIDGSLVRLRNVARVALGILGTKLEEDERAAAPWNLLGVDFDDAAERGGVGFGVAGFGEE
jgi:hypothetical protein